MRRWLTVSLTCLLPLVLLGCGGGSSGGSSGSTGNGTVSATGKFTLTYTGGGIPGVKHAWVTVTKVVLNEDIDKTWVQGDTSWKVVTLNMPVTIDLAAANGYIVGSASGGGASVPIGTYNQIRLILAGHDEPLTTSAAAPAASGVVDSGRPLTYNAQVEYDNGAIVPIELPSLLTGFRLDRGVQITSSATTEATLGALAAHIGLDRNLVRFDSGYEHLGSPVDAMTLRMRSYSTRGGADAGIILGQIDPNYLCSSVVVTNCASDVTVSLYGRSRALSAGGAVLFDDDLFPRMINHYTVRVEPTVSSGAVVQQSGLFFMGPLLPDGSVDNTYDLVIRGKGMRTMVIQDVPLKSLSVDDLISAADGVSLLGTYIGRTWDAIPSGQTTARTYRSYIRPVLIGSDVESEVSLSAAQSPKNSRVILGMRLNSRSAEGAPLPYELMAGNTDPFTGLLRKALPLPRGNPVVVSYPSIVSDNLSGVGNAPISSSLFLPEQTVGGDETYARMALGRYYDEGVVDTASPVRGTDSGSVFAPLPPLAYKAGVVETSVTVTATGLPDASTLESAYLVVSDVGGIVHTEDVKSRIAGGSLTVSNVNLPAGVVSNGYATAVYSFAIRTRALSSTTPAGTTWYRGNTQLNLRAAPTTATATIP